MRAPGPGALVAAAFIGPGTVTTCTLAGLAHGSALLWALLFATIATIVLQDMAARLGARARLGLGEALWALSPDPLLRWTLGGLVFVALAIGNAAYEAGNLTGAALGLTALPGLSRLPLEAGVALLAGVAAVLLLQGTPRLLQLALTVLVMLMGLAFLIAGLIVWPDPRSLLAGFVPRLPDGAALTAIALIGTTVVPYNLFLHAAAARAHWKTSAAAGAARRDSLIAVALGGLVSMVVLATAAGAASTGGALATADGAAALARALEPVFGTGARVLLGFGLLGAGLTSALTAPMATAWALTELWPAADETTRSRRFRWIALSVLGIGTGVSLLGLRPLTLIVVAQAANGLLLPILAGFLLLVMNQRRLLGTAVNGPLSNVAGALVVLMTLALGGRSVLGALGGL